MAPLSSRRKVRVASVSRSEAGNEWISGRWRSRFRSRSCCPGKMEVSGGFDGIVAAERPDVPNH